LGRPAGQGRRSGWAGWAGEEKKKGNPIKLISIFRKMNKEIWVTEIIGENPKNSQKIVEKLGRQECELE
jgi:predicted transcriptional regulator